MIQYSRPASRAVHIMIIYTFILNTVVSGQLYNPQQIFDGFTNTAYARILIGSYLCGQIDTYTH